MRKKYIYGGDIHTNRYTHTDGQIYGRHIYIKKTYTQKYIHTERTYTQRNLSTKGHTHGGIHTRRRHILGRGIHNIYKRTYTRRKYTHKETYIQRDI